MPPKKLRRRRSSNGHRRSVATRERPKWQHASLWPSHDQRETMRRGTHWWPSSPPKITPPYPWRRRVQRWRAPPWWKMKILPGGARTTRMPPRCSSTCNQLPQRPLRPRKRRATICSPAIHHQHRPTSGERRSREKDWKPSRIWTMSLSALWGSRPTRLE